MACPSRGVKTESEDSEKERCSSYGVAGHFTRLKEQIVKSATVALQHDPPPHSQDRLANCEKS
jgi:hypothetical protein